MLFMLTTVAYSADTSITLYIIYIDVLLEQVMCLMEGFFYLLNTHINYSMTWHCAI